MKNKIFKLIFLFIFLVMLTSCGDIQNPVDDPKLEGEYVITFYVDGEIYCEINYTKGEDISIPPFPTKDGYTGYWEEFSTSDGGNIKVNAVYIKDGSEYLIIIHQPDGTTLEINWQNDLDSFIPEEYFYDFDGYEYYDYEKKTESNEIHYYPNYNLIEYNLDLYVDGEYYQTITYNKDNFDKLNLPIFPERGEEIFIWDTEDFHFGATDLHGHYHHKSEYMVTFNCQGKLFYSYINSDGSVTPPSEEDIFIPGYKFVGWDHPLTNFNGGEYVFGQYEIINYELTFMVDGNIFRVITYNINSNLDNLRIPTVPNKDGFTGEWESFNINDYCNQTINAIYTEMPIIYYVSYYDRYGNFVNEQHEAKRGDTLDLPEEAKLNPLGEFVEWIGDLDNIYQYQNIVAKYKYTVQFVYESEVLKEYQYYSDGGYPEITSPDEIKIDGYIGVWPEDVILFQSIVVEPEFLKHDYYTEGLVIDEYYYDNQKMIVKDYIGTDVDVTIPGYYYGKPVIYIGEYAFSNKPIESVYIPETVESIFQCAFEKTNIESFVIPDTVNHIGLYIFNECSKLTELTVPFIGQRLEYEEFEFNCDYDSMKNFSDLELENLKKLTVTKQTHISNEILCYYSVYDYKSFDLLQFNNLQTIEDGAFENINIKELRINSNLLEINTLAFTNSIITDLYLPSSISSFVEGSFTGADITNLHYDATNDNVEYSNGLLVSNGNTIYFNNNSPITELVIPDSTRVISDSFFLNNQNLISIDLGNVEVIGSEAFVGCINLENLILSDNLTEIGYFAFYNCEKITEIILPESVSIIKDGAFRDCDSLVKAYIPKTVTELGGSILADCYSLLDVTIPTVTSGGNLFNSSGVNVEKLHITNASQFSIYAFSKFKSLKEVIIEGSIEVISKYAFENCENLNRIVLCDNIKKIDVDAFRGCINLNNITFSNNLEEICQSAFENCTNLCNLTLPDTLTTIGDNAFSNCDAITEFICSENVVSIGKTAFAYCDNLITAKIPYDINMDVSKMFDKTPLEKLTLYNVSELSSSSFRRLYYSDVPTNEICNTLKELEIIGDIEGFNSELVNLNNLRKVILPDSLKIIGSSAFSECVSLKDITLPSTLEEIGSSAFSGCVSLKDITLPSTLEIIGSHAFSRCVSLKDITLPSTLEIIGSYAFDRCTAIEEIIIPDNVQTIGSYAFSGCTAIEEIIIPDNVQTIGDYAFNGCNKLSSITIPISLTYLGYGAFRNCSLIKEVVIPKGITLIYSYTFEGCSKLEKVEFEGQITSIGNSSFANCESLKKIDLPSSVSTIGENAFRECYNLYQVILRSSNLNIGNYAFEKCYNLVEVYEVADNIELDLYRSNKYGYLNAYLLAIHTSLEEESSITIDENEYYFINDGTRDYLFYYGGTQLKLSLPVRDISYAINDYAFLYSDVEEVVISSCVESFGNHVFNYCENLNKITFEERENNLYISHGFEYCPSLRTVTIPLHILSSTSFDECYNLEQMIVYEPSSIIEAKYRLVELYNLTGVSTSPYISSYLSVHTDLNEQSSLIQDEEGFCFVMGERNYLYNYYGDESDVVLPSSFTYDINKYAFFNMAQISSIVIPEGVEEIGLNSFVSSANINEITLPSTLRHIGYDAFKYVNRVQNIYIPTLVDWFEIDFDNSEAVPSGKYNDYETYTSKYTNLVINGETLFDLQIPEQITQIKDYAMFSINIGDLYLHKDITSIGTRAFETQIGAIYIEDLASWINIDFADLLSNPTYYKSQFGCQVYFDGEIITDLVIPESVTEIKPYVFVRMIFNSVLVHENVTRIGEDAFYGMNINKLIVPFIGESEGHETNNTIYHFSSRIDNYNLSYFLKELVITNTKVLAENALSGINKLTTVTLPSTLESVKANAFYNLPSLSKVIITDENSWYNIAFENEYSNPLYLAHKLYINDMEVVDLVIPDSINTLKDYSFAGISVDNVNVHSNVISIGSSAFIDATIANKVLTSSIDSWANTTFGNEYSNPTYITRKLYLLESDNVSLVESVSLNETNVPTVNNYAFLYLDDLRKATLGGNGIVLGEVAFNYANITELSMAGAINNYASRFTNLEVLVLLDGILEIYENTFNGFTTLKSIYLCDTLTKIRLDAFDSCSNLEEVIIESLESFLKIEFENRYSNPLYYANTLINESTNSEVVDLVIPSEITEINSYAFIKGTGIKTVYIPDTITSIGYNAFEGCENIEKVSSDSLEHWQTILLGSYSNPIIYSRNLYIGDELLTDITISNETILPYTFNGIILNNVTLSEGVKVIDSHSFADTSINTINLPSTLESIIFYAFEDSQINLVETLSLSDWYKIHISDINSSPINCALQSTFGNDETTVITLTKDLEIINDYAFCGVNVEDVIITDYSDSNLSTLFVNCKTIKNLTISSIINDISETSFGELAPSITQVTLDATVKDIYTSIFNTMVNLETLIYEGYTIISVEDCFKDCTKLSRFEVIDACTFANSGVSLFGNSYSSPLCHGARIYENGVEVKNLVISERVAVSGYVFFNCPSIETVTVTNTSYIHIGIDAFYGCVNLKSVDLTEASSSTEKSSISIAAFYNCPSLVEVKLSNNLYQIDDYAFGNCTSLEEITLPNSLIRFDYETFRGCTSLIKVNISTKGWVSKTYDADIWDYVITEMNFSNPEVNAEIFKNNVLDNYKNTIIYTTDPDILI